MEYEGRQEVTLVAQAKDAIDRKRREKESVEEAQQGVPELRKKIDRLFEDDERRLVDGLNAIGRDLPPDRIVKVRRGNVEVRKITSDFMERVARKTAYKKSHLRMRVLLEIPGDEEGIRVEIAKDSPLKDLDVYSDGATIVNVVPLDSVLKIYGASAHIESKAYNHEPFNMLTPMGSNSDRGPVWSRDMNMDDFENYNRLLDRLSESDVIRVESDR